MTRRLLSLIIPLLFCATIVEAQQEEEVTRMTFETYIEKTASRRSYETDTLDVKIEGNDLTITGYFPSGNPQRAEFQELKIEIWNFNGRGAYQIGGDRATWQNLNSGDGLCHSMTGSLRVLGYDPVTGIDGTFEFRCESQPQVGGALYTRINGTFVKGLEPKILTPVEGDTLEPHKDVEITWQMPGREKIDLVLVLEPDPEGEERNRFVIAREVDATLESYTWEVPDTMSPQAFILAIDPLSPETPVVSDSLLMRAPQLARLRRNGPDDECPNCPYYEIFNPIKHGWSHANTPVNFATALRDDYPERFNYIDGIDPVSNSSYRFDTELPPGMPFSNRNYPEWENWVRAFGVDQCYVTASDGTTTLYGVRPDVVRLWARYTGIWGGSCHALAVGTAMALYYPGRFQSVFGNSTTIEQARSIADVPMSTGLKDDMSTLYAYVYGKGLQANAAIAGAWDPRTLVDHLRRVLLEDEIDPGFQSNPVLIIRNDGPDEGAHSLMVYEIQEDENIPGTFDLFVYDPNYPGDDSPSIKIVSSQNRWEYDLGSEVWSGGRETIYPADELNNYFRPAEVEPNPVFTRINFSVAPGNSVTATASGGGSFSWDDENGFSTTASDRALPLYPIAGPADPYAFQLENSEWIAEVTAGDTTGISLMIESRDLLLTLYTDAPQGRSDRVRWDERSLTLYNPDAEARSVYFDAIMRLENGTRTLGLFDLSLAGGDSIRFEILADDLLIENYGGSSRYRLVVRQKNGEGFLEGEYDPVDLDAGDGHRIDPPWWNLGTRLPIYVTDGDGGVKDTIIRINSLLGVDREERILRGLNLTNPLPDLGTLDMHLGRSGELRVEAYDPLGRRAGLLYSGEVLRGDHSLPIDARSLAPGHYILTLSLDGERIGSVQVVRVR